LHRSPVLHLHPDHQPPSGRNDNCDHRHRHFKVTARPGERRRSRIILTLLLSLFLVYSFVPLVYLVLSATKTNGDLFTTFGFGFGTEFNLWQNLSDLFSRDNGIFSRWMFNSLLYSTVAGLGAAILSTAAGYAFAKFKFVGRNLMFALVLGAVMIPQTALVVPIFLLLALSGLSDNPLGVILPSMISPIGVYLMRVYIEQGVDDELLDAARIDGAGEFVIFRAIVLRLVAPGMVTVALLSFVGTWNNYFLPLIVLRSQEYQPITVGLATWYQLAQRRWRRTGAVLDRHHRRAGQHHPGHRGVPAAAAVLAGRPHRRRHQIDYRLEFSDYDDCLEIAPLSVWRPIATDTFLVGTPHYRSMSMRAIGSATPTAWQPRASTRCDLRNSPGILSSRMRGRSTSICSTAP
jgi:multiple sugar transport system permease protein